MLVTARCISSPCASNRSPSARRVASLPTGRRSTDENRCWRSEYIVSSRRTTIGAGQSPRAFSRASTAFASSARLVGPAQDLLETFLGVAHVGGHRRQRRQRQHDLLVGAARRKRR